MMLETERLCLRLLTIEDAVPLYYCFGDEQVMQFWHNGFDSHFEATQRRVMNMIQHWTDYGFGDWAVIEKSSQVVIGFCGLHYITGMKEVNLGYVFRKTAHGSGYGAEAGQKALAYGFSTLKMQQVIAVIDPRNISSRKVAEKCGMEFWKESTWMDRQRIIYKKDSPPLI